MKAEDGNANYWNGLGFGPANDATEAVMAPEEVHHIGGALVGDLDVSGGLGMAPSRYSDFQFSAYHGLGDDGSIMGALTHVPSSGFLVGPDTPSTPAGSSAREDLAMLSMAAVAGNCVDSMATSRTLKTEATAAKAATEVPSKGKPASTKPASVDGAFSDDGGSPGSGGGHGEAHAGATSLLDEPLADEFCLELRGPAINTGAEPSRRSNNVGGGGGGGTGHGGDGRSGDSLSSGHGHGGVVGGGSAEGYKYDKSGVETAPPWSELKTKAGKDRKRLPLACIACRRKKIRCSGEKPACKHCLRSRTPCVYKATARKAAPRTDYMTMLDKRMKRMEDRLIKAMPRNSSEAAVDTSIRSIVKPVIPGTQPTTIETSQIGTGSVEGGVGNGGSGGRTGAADKGAMAKKRGAAEAFGTELAKWARMHPKNRLSHQTVPRNVLLQQESEENILLQEGEEALPPRDLQEHLAEVFFENIYGQVYHLLHKPSFMRKLRAGILPPVLILSVCAVSARYSTHPSLASVSNFLRGEEWASRARDIVTQRYEWPNITILTCLLILGLHEFGTCHGGRSWSFGGQAIRMAFALQLHKDLEHDPMPPTGGAPLSFIDREIRRRTMWACFLMDRFNSAGTDRPTFIKEESLKIQLPIKERYFQLDIPGPTENLAGQPVPPPPQAPVDDRDVDQRRDAKANMGVAAYMIRAIAVWGRVINYVNQGGKELDPFPMWSPESGYSRLVKQADELPLSLPPSLTFSAENLQTHETDGMANQFLFLHIAIQQNILFLNRFAVSPPSGTLQKGSIPKSFVTKAGAKAFTAANRISDLLQEAESFLISAPFVGYCAFLSSTVHIFGVFSGSPTLEATSKRNLTINVKFLSKMKRYWGMLHFMTENLREQYRTCADTARHGTPSNENTMAGASPIFQYGDWFDRYPHGVAISDFDEPATPFKQNEKRDDAVLEQKQELRTVAELFPSKSANANGSDSVAAASEGTSTNGTTRSGGLAQRKSVPEKANVGEPRTATDMPPMFDAMPPSAMDAMDVSKDVPQTVAATNSATAASHQAARRQQQSNNMSIGDYYSTSLGNGSHPTGGGAIFDPLALSQTPVAPAAVAGFHPAAMSSISSVAVDNGLGPFSHHHSALLQQHSQQQQQSQQQQSKFFSPNLLALSLHQQFNGMLPQLDRQLVFNAYGSSMEGAGAAIANGTALDSLRRDGGGASGVQHTTAANASVTGAGGLVPTADISQSYGRHGQEASSAWFMPFNMEPPELGQDSTGLSGSDQFANLFGSSSVSGAGRSLNGMPDNN